MEGVMFDLFRRILKDEAGFTAIEYSLAGALLLIAFGQLVANKL
jgi:Flp pilus assembly pilin Flp